MKETLKKIQSGASLSQEEMTACMRAIMDGTCEEAQIAAFLMGLSMRGETVDEICGAVSVMREKSLKINAPAHAIDCCGTGGDHHGTYNISTAVAIIAASCGVPVAKHGNRAASSKSGAADVLEALGVNLDCPHEQLEIALKQFNFAFLMAPRHHTAMKYVVPVRRAMGVRTIFNLLGPLSNPAGTQSQLIGVFDRKWIMPIAQSLQKLGTRHAWVVCGADGLDEITITGETHIAILKDDAITQSTITPEDFGLARHTLDAIKGEDAATNAQALLALLQGEKSAYRDIVLANTAALLNISGLHNDLKQAAQAAAQAIDSGKALETLNTYIAFTKENGASQQ